MISVTPIRFVRDISAATRFWAAIGLVEDTEQTSRTWAAMDAEHGSVMLHIGERPLSHEHAGAVSLQVTVGAGELDAVYRRLKTAGWAPSDVIDETFGRYLLVTDPDGYVVQVNEVLEELKRSYETAASKNVI